MSSPWEELELSSYEAHMKRSEVYQLQTLSAIMSEQLYYREAKTAMVLGVAGGNGLEHIAPERFERVYGIDINQSYLSECKKRFCSLDGCLELLRADLLEDDAALPECELVIADLFIEYIGVERFAAHIKRLSPKWVSCVVQQKGECGFVSQSPYISEFDGIAKIHTDISPVRLIEAMSRAGFLADGQKKYPLPNKKVFVRLDFRRE